MKKSQTCLITGASGGIGGEIAKVLDQHGYKVIIQGRNRDKLLQLKSVLGDQTQIILGDLNNQDDRERLLIEAFDCGNIDLLVNAAGISQFSAFESIDKKDISKLVETNLITPMLLTQSFIECSKRQSDKEKTSNQLYVTIVNVGSAFGYIGYPGFSSYCASKFGLRGFTEALAREYSDTQFRFGYFAPRATRTDINAKRVDEMNAALGNSVDSANHVANQFISFLNDRKREKVLGWPEKIFVRINSLLPVIVDNAIKSKLTTIKRFMHA